MDIAIYKTEDYSKFKTLKQNRNINHSHVAQLCDRIRSKNLLHLKPIFINSAFEVFDGQHRLEAARILKIEIYYTIDDALSYDDIILLNTHNSNWRISDYIHYYKLSGVDSFDKLVAFKNRFPKFNTSIILILCAKNAVRDTPSLKQGIVDMRNYERGLEYAKYMTDLKKVFNQEVWIYTQAFTVGFIRFMQQHTYDHSRFVSHISNYRDLFHICKNSADYLAMLLNIVNTYE